MRLLGSPVKDVHFFVRVRPVFRAQRVKSWLEEDAFLLDNAFALIDEYICADQLATFTFRLQKSEPYIRSGAYKRRN